MLDQFCALSKSSCSPYDLIPISPWSTDFGVISEDVVVVLQDLWQVIDEQNKNQRFKDAPLGNAARHCSPPSTGSPESKPMLTISE